MVWRQCKGQVPSDHQGSGCPICGNETVFDLAVQPALTKSEQELAAGEQPPHAGADGGEAVRHVLVAR